MVIMTMQSEGWRARLSVARARVRAIPVGLRAVFIVSLGTALVGAVISSPFVAIVGMGLAGGVIVGQESK